MWNQIRSLIRTDNAAFRMPQAVFSPALDLLFPRNVACAACDMALGENFPYNLCPACTAGLMSVGAYGCRGCGRFVGAFASEGLCPHCLGEPRWFINGISGFRYTDGAQRIVHGLKYHNRPWLAHTMAAQLYPAALDLCRAHVIEALVPVPVHGDRLKERGYNQAQLLARELSALPEMPQTQLMLTRVRNTIPQKQLTLSERIVNVKNAFTCNPDILAASPPKRVLLVDDVLTTGNTLNACAKALRTAGVDEVHVMTFASVSG